MAPGAIAKPKGKNNKADSSKTISKNKVGKADYGKTATVAQRKKDVQVAIRKATVVLDEYHKQVKEQQSQLDELTKSYNNGEHPEHKDEYERVKAELEKSSATLAASEANLQNLRGEEMQLETMEGVEQTLPANSKDSEPTGSDLPGSDPNGSLFVNSDPAGFTGQPGHSFGSSFRSFADSPGGPPDINLIDEEGKKSTPEPPSERDPDDEGLFTLDDFKKATGRDDDGEVAAWRQQGYSKPIIIRYGPPNAHRYERSTSARSGLAINEEETPQFGPDHRLGDVKVNKKFVRRMHEFKGIQGVAFDGPIEGMKPKQPGEKGRKFPRTELWVKWEIDGEIERRWEVRASIKHLWPNPGQCDEYIYIVAQYHAERHQQWLDGQRQVKEKSPTPLPANIFQGGLKASPGLNKSTPGGPGEAPLKTEGNGSSPTQTITSDKMSMKDWKEEYFTIMDLEPTEMTAEEKHEMMEAWRVYKNS